MTRDSTAGFVTWAKEQLDLLEETLCALPAMADPGLCETMVDLLNTGARIAHSIKGAAMRQGCAGAAELAHRFEDGLKPLLAEERPPGEAELKELLDGLGKLSAAVSEVKCPTKDGGQMPRVAAVSVDSAALDRLLEATQELLRCRTRLSQCLLEGARLSLAGCDASRVSSGAGPTAETIRQSFRHASEAEELAEELDLRVETLARCVGRARLVTMRSCLSGMRSSFRQAAQSCGLEAELIVEGADLEVEKGLAETVATALDHLVRNSVAHGLEPPAERTAAGKPIRGRVRLAFERSGKGLVVSVQDDGRGVDLARVAAKAVQRGLLSESEARDASEERLLDIIFAPGFSSKETADRLSGRGVGLDAVRRTIEGLAGSLQVENSPARGLTFRLEVPLRLMTTPILKVRAGANTFGMAAGLVSAVAGRGSFRVVEAGEAQTADGFPCLRLTDLLAPETSSDVEAGAARTCADRPHLLVSCSDRTVAIEVDAVLSYGREVVQSLGARFTGEAPVLGAADQGDAGPLVVLNVHELLRLGAARVPSDRLVVPVVAAEGAPLS
ncbi:MAG: Hpt domain-containing protein [Candidatus Riflebacteria bacterium]|nr:Hpt domain-containing protein [Candidatus Riflebacteria bacterium]